VQEAAVPRLRAWQNFYVIVGSLVCGTDRLGVCGRDLDGIKGEAQVRGDNRDIHHAKCRAFLHCVPYRRDSQRALASALECWQISLGICGLAGGDLQYVIIQRARHQADYQPVLEDWLWYTIFPFISYAALVVAVLAIPSNATLALFVIGAATVLFLFIGIHNAWDIITYVTFTGSPSENESQE
jgi:hypothetical protein